MARDGLVSGAWIIVMHGNQPRHCRRSTEKPHNEVLLELRVTYARLFLNRL